MRLLFCAELFSLHVSLISAYTPILLSDTEIFIPQERFYSCRCKAASAASILRNSLFLTRIRQIACARIVAIQLIG